MVAAFNSASGSKEARESLSEANKGYRECTEASNGCGSVRCFYHNMIVCVNYRLIQNQRKNTSKKQKT